MIIILKEIMSQFWETKDISFLCNETAGAGSSSDYNKLKIYNITFLTTRKVSIAPRI